MGAGCKGKGDRGDKKGITKMCSATVTPVPAIISYTCFALKLFRFLKLFQRPHYIPIKLPADLYTNPN